MLLMFHTHRNKQHDDLSNTTKKYQTDRKDVLYWLDNTERRLDQVEPQAMDTNTVQILLKELRVSLPHSYFPQGSPSCNETCI